MKSSAHNARKQALSATRGEKVVSLHQVRSSWVLQLDNFVLRSLVMSSAPHLHPTQSQIDAINQACFELLSHDVFHQRLKAANIFLNKKPFFFPFSFDRLFAWGMRGLVRLLDFFFGK